MTDLQIFNHPQFGQIRTAGTSDAPEFCAMDVCTALGYSNGRDALSKHVDEGDVAKRDTPTNGGIQQLSFVNESGLYALIFGSHLPAARQFKRWVTSEVLPALRRTGSYAVSQLTRKQLAQMVIQAEEENERLAIENKMQKQQLDEQAPKVVFADAVTGSATNILIRDLAKLIQQNGYDIGEVRLFRWMRDNHYLTIENRPMQRYVEQGLFFLTEGSHSEKGVMKTHFTTKVTPKGQQYFINKFINTQNA